MRSGDNFSFWLLTNHNWGVACCTYLYSVELATSVDFNRFIFIVLQQTWSTKSASCNSMVLTKFPDQLILIALKIDCSRFVTVKVTKKCKKTTPTASENIYTESISNFKIPRVFYMHQAPASEWCVLWIHFFFSFFFF